MYSTTTKKDALVLAMETIFCNCNCFLQY